MIRIPNTDLAPFALCEFCKSMQTHWDGPQEPEKQVYQNSNVRRSAWCEVRRRVLYKICKKCISRARAPRGRDVWAALIDIKSDTVFLAATKSWTLEPLAFDEYCRFDTTSFASGIKRGSLYPTCERRSIKTAVFIES